jgi:hypothetical protein
LNLSNGKTLKTNSAEELATFYETRGESIAPAPVPKKGKKKKERKAVAAAE